MARIVQAHREYYQSGQTRAVRFRRTQLQLLLKAIGRYEAELCEALWRDLHKSREEAFLTEIALVKAETKGLIRHLKHWSMTRRAATPLFMFGSCSRIRQEPYGVVAILYTVLLPDDLLYVMGDFDKVQHFAEAYRLELLDTHMPEERSAINRNSLDFYDIGIAEIVLMPTSGLINRTIGESGFRDKYHVNILGIRRKREYILNNLKDEKMHSGDVLLVQGSWNAIGHLSQENSDWVVLGQPLNEAAKVTLDYKAPLAGVTMLLMIMTMVFDFIPIAPVTAIMIAAVLMVLTGCFRNVEAAYKTINWESIVLIAAMLPMSMALEKTGVSEYISNSLVSGLGVYGPIALLAGIYFTTSLLTMFISNTATAVLLAPIALQSAIQIGTSPYPFLFAVTVGASMCFASPFSTPPNALVMPAGQYTFMDFIKVGLPLQILIGIVMILTLPLLFPF